MKSLSITSKDILIPLFLVLFAFALQSCMKTNDPPYDIVRTDVMTTVTVKDISGNPVADEEVNWRIHIYNWQTYTDSNMESGVVTTGSDGKVDLPLYECQINAGLLVRITAYVAGQDVHTNEPASVSFNDAANVANAEGFAEVQIDYEITKP